jgi:predicted ribosome quality control (RQC) complex YloA/Tae2 family protein
MWAVSSGVENLQVENARKTDDGAILGLSGGSELVFVLKGREAFAYTRCASPAVGSEIWPNLKHAKIVKLAMDPLDRILHIHLWNRDIYQQIRDYRLIAEFTPPKPNLIIARDEDGRSIIEDALHKYGLADNPQRQVLPRLEYQPPTTGFSVEEEDIRFPLEVVPADGGEALLCQDMNSYFALYHEKVLKLSRQLEYLRTLKARWEKRYKKCQGKLDKQRQELDQAKNMEYWLACAEVIKYNLGNIRKGQSELAAVNYLDPELKEIVVSLSEDKSPRENMDAYLKKYRKARNGLIVIEAKISETEQELAGIARCIEQIAAGEDPVEPIQSNRSSLGGASVSGWQDKLLRLRLNADFEIVIGRKARENDYLTTQLARPHDWWFHTRIYHGGHVVLRCLTKKSPDEGLVKICCGLAAWYSKARFSANVPVDYTQIRFVRKPRRSAPGFVTYTTHQTVFADPIDLRAARERLGL